MTVGRSEEDVIGFRFRGCASKGLVTNINRPPFFEIRIQSGTVYVSEQVDVLRQVCRYVEGV